MFVPMDIKSKVVIRQKKSKGVIFVLSLVIRTCLNIFLSEQNKNYR